jgi:hypothetical protein
MEAAGSNNNDTYIKILVSEHLQERLMNHCRKNPFSVTKLYPHLLPEYRQDVDALFTQYIRPKAEHASTRGMYQDVCNIIREYAEACGKKNAKNILLELQEKYRRQPAFLDELGKIK